MAEDLQKNKAEIEEMLKIKYYPDIISKKEERRMNFCMIKMSKKLLKH